MVYAHAKFHDRVQNLLLCTKLRCVEKLAASTLRQELLKAQYKLMYLMSLTGADCCGAYLALIPQTYMVATLDRSSVMARLAYGRQLRNTILGWWASGDRPACDAASISRAFCSDHPTHDAYIVDTWVEAMLPYLAQLPKTC